MKHLFFTLCIALMSATAFSQAYSLRVINETPCMVFFRIVGDEVCRCGETYMSTLIALPGGGAMLTFPTSTSLLGSFPPAIPKSINAAYLYPNTICPPALYGVVGEQPCGYPAITSYLAPNRDCTPCTNIRAEWISADNCQYPATLRFF